MSPIEQRFSTLFLPTHSHDRTDSLPLCSILSLNKESMQTSQLEQACGQCDETPSTLHFQIGSLPTHLQDLFFLIFPSSNTSILYNESKQEGVIVGEEVQLPHVNRHVSETPSIEHRFFPTFLPAHSHDFINSFPLYSTLNLNGESAQLLHFEQVS